MGKFHCIVLKSNLMCMPISAASPPQAEVLQESRLGAWLDHCCRGDHASWVWAPIYHLAKLITIMTWHCLRHIVMGRRCIEMLSYWLNTSDTVPKGAQYLQWIACIGYTKDGGTLWQTCMLPQYWSQTSQRCSVVVAWAQIYVSAPFSYGTWLPYNSR